MLSCYKWVAGVYEMGSPSVLGAARLVLGSLEL